MCKGVNVCVEESLGMFACANVPLQLSCVCTSVGLEELSVLVLRGVGCRGLRCVCLCVYV